jgi:trans-aconitate methyltransferase
MTSRQTWNAERYAQNARFVADLAQPVLELLNPGAGERILDLGCGDGVLTERLQGAGCRVVGVDASPEMVNAARARGLDARALDIREIAFAEEFDGVFSNAVLHWVTQPDGVIDGVWRALRPGGRFVAEMGGHGCVQSVVDALDRALTRRGIEASTLNPWYFPTPEDYAARLSRRGFRVPFVALIPRPTRIPGDLGGWLETFCESFLNGVPLTERTAFVDEVRENLRSALCDARGVWTLDYVRLRFAAEKPSSLSG